MKLVIALVFALLLVGCASDPLRYQNVPSSKLCIDYLSIDNGGRDKNIMDVMLEKQQAEAWGGELKRRGEDCSNPAFIAAAQQRLSARAQAAAAKPAPIKCTTRATGNGNSTTECQ
jgi:hypothetical protein